MPNDFFIDKSLYNADQLAQLEELLKIGRVEKSAVDPAAAKDEMEDQEPAVPPKKKKTTEKAEVEDMPETKKSAAPAEPELPQFVKDAIAKSEAFIEEQKKKEMVELAKKYDILGQKPEELGPQLYELKKSNEDMYNTVIKTLDGQVALIEKSPVFAEIGKSGRGGSTVASGGAVAKAEAKAREIQKAHPDMSHDEAIAKAWMDNPELMDEYDAEYFGH